MTMRLTIVLSLLALTACRSNDEQFDEDFSVADQLVAGQEGSPQKKDLGPQKKDLNPQKKDLNPQKLDGQKKDLGLPKKDVGSPKLDTTAPKPDTSAWPAIVPGRVAAIQYGQGMASQVSASAAASKYPDIYAVEELIYQARQGGAQLIVVPEFYVYKQQPYAPDPKVGDNPAVTPSWPSTDYALYLSQLAKELGSYLVYDLITYTGTEGQPDYKMYNTQLALAPDGKIVAKHHKFELFGGEVNWATAGNDVMVFDTPLGKVGLLICADIYGSVTLRNKLVSLGARLVAISSFWTVSTATSSYKSYASQHKVYAIAANTSNSPGYGGGIYNPSGVALAEWTSGSPKIVYYTFPQIPVP
jgi:predicted amidohydrolase